ncbi:hypothetical protein NL676_027969 [Syzygium grande]|nr:hypothetical protein NL676_027969 [Syzygium grande]
MLPSLETHPILLSSLSLLLLPRSSLRLPLPPRPRSRFLPRFSLTSASLRLLRRRSYDLPTWIRSNYSGSPQFSSFEAPSLRLD